jgi:hypothetical protein
MPNWNKPTTLRTRLDILERAWLLAERVERIIDGTVLAPHEMAYEDVRYVQALGWTIGEDGWWAEEWHWRGEM